MRRKEFISKKLAVVLMAATMLVVPIMGAMVTKVDVHAEQHDYTITTDSLKTPVEDNNNLQEYVDEVQKDTIMDANNGVILQNNGTIVHNSEEAGVYENDGAIRYNDGTVPYNDYEINNNSETGYIINNSENGIIFKNDGRVDNNNRSVYNGNGGYVDNNWNEGVVLGSPGNFSDKEGSEGPYLGTIRVNNGRIINGSGENDVLTVNYFMQGDIDTGLEGYNPDRSRGGVSVYEFLENFQDRKGKVHIINNYDEKEFKENDLILVDNQYHGVFLADTDNATTEYNNFSDLKDFEHYVLTAQNKADIPINGSITIRPNSGYKITDNGQLSGEVDKLTYNLNKNNDGSYTVSFASVKGDVFLTADMLNLIVSQLTAEEAASIQQIVVDGKEVKVEDIKDSDVIVIKGSSDNSGTPAEASAPAGYNLTDAAIKNITDQVQKLVAANGNDIAALEVIDIYFGDKIDMTPGAIKYLCEKVPVAKRCHFDYQDQEHVLFIPAFDLNAPAYAEGLEVLDKEPAHTAGFLRIKDIFVKLGFAAKVVEEEQEAAE